MCEAAADSHLTDAAQVLEPAWRCAHPVARRIPPRGVGLLGMVGRPGRVVQGSGQTVHSGRWRSTKTTARWSGDHPREWVGHPPTRAPKGAGRPAEATSAEVHLFRTNVRLLEQQLHHNGCGLQTLASAT